MLIGAGEAGMAIRWVSSAARGKRAQQVLRSRASRALAQDDSASGCLEKRKVREEVPIRSHSKEWAR